MKKLLTAKKKKKKATKRMRKCKPNIKKTQNEKKNSKKKKKSMVQKKEGFIYEWKMNIILYINEKKIIWKGYKRKNYVKKIYILWNIYDNNKVQKD